MRKKKTATKKLQLWRQYEDAVRAIISQHREQLGLDSVKPTAGKVQGETGPWNIEVIAYTEGTRKIVLFEVRRHKRDIIRAEAGEFAFRIEDTGASGGYFVIPLGRKLTRGAKQIADKKAIRHIEVSSDATPENYILRFLDSFFVRATDSMADVISGIRDEFRIMIADESGNPVREVTVEELRSLSDPKAGS